MSSKHMEKSQQDVKPERKNTSNAYNIYYIKLTPLDEMSACFLDHGVLELDKEEMLGDGYAAAERIALEPNGNPNYLSTTQTRKKLKMSTLSQTAIYISF